MSYTQRQTFEATAATGFFLQGNTLAELGGKHLSFLENLPNQDPLGSFSWEQVGELAQADGILVSAVAVERMTELRANELWQRLPAVQEGHVVTTDIRTNYGSVYAGMECLRLLDRLYETPR